jgi:hypothetical protein
MPRLARILVFPTRCLVKCCGMPACVVGVNACFLFFPPVSSTGQLVWAGFAEAVLQHGANPTPTCQRGDGGRHGTPRQTL